MSNKTEHGYYNEDDFVEEDSKLHEITVKITLCEYRNLISERCYNEKEIDKLHKENTELKESLENVTNLFIEAHPECRAAIELLSHTSWSKIKNAMEEGAKNEAD